jgi:hypothetical protein
VKVLVYYMRRAVQEEYLGKAVVEAESADAMFPRVKATKARLSKG